MKCMTRFRIYIGAHHCKKPIDRARRKLHEPAWLARCYRPLCFESGGIITPKLCRCCSESAWMPPCTVLLTFDLLGFLLEAGSQGSQRSALKGASPAGTPRSNKSVQFGGIGGVKMPKIRIPKMGYLIQTYPCCRHVCRGVGLGFGRDGALSWLSIPRLHDGAINLL